VVSGSITDVRTNSEVVQAQLDGTSVWVPIGSVSSPESLIGSTIWAQGPVQTAEGETVVDASPLFVGREPLDTITPENRMIRRTGDFTVYKNGGQIAAGLEFATTSGTAA
jgi:hypothetical protein